MTQPGPSRARSTRREPRPIWGWMLPIMSVLVAAGIPLLLWYAWDAIANSTDGKISEAVTDPLAPGYQVSVVPSPTQMILSLDPDGALAMVTVLSLGSNDIGGNILHLTPETLLPDDPDYDRIVDAYADKGDNRTRRAVAELIGINVDDISVIDNAIWAQLVGPAGAIPVDIGEDLVEVTANGTQVAYGAGNVAVVPDRVAEFLAWVNPEDHPSAGRLGRAGAFWRAWLASIAASSDPGIVPGEQDTGIGRFLRGLAAGDFVVATYSMTEVVLADGIPAAEVDAAEIRALIEQMVPFPIGSTAGARPSVRVLDGVGGLDLPGVYSPPLVHTGAQIDALGNAGQFGRAATEVVYHDTKWGDAALAFSEVLGGAAVTFEQITDVLFDVTVIIGEDQAAGVG